MRDMFYDSISYQQILELITGHLLCVIFGLVVQMHITAVPI